VVPAEFQLTAEEEPPRPAPQIIDSNASLTREAEGQKRTLQAMAPVECENYTLPSFDLLDPINHHGSAGC
jgi:hypothetical protein